MEEYLYLDQFQRIQGFLFVKDSSRANWLEIDLANPFVRKLNWALLLGYKEYQEFVLLRLGYHHPEKFKKQIQKIKDLKRQKTKILFWGNLGGYISSAKPSL